MTPPPTTDCRCRATGSVQSKDRRELGWDSHYADVEVFRCASCEQPWLAYRYENESFARSARTYLGAISEQDLGSVNAMGAKDLLESLPSYFCGGPGVGGGVYESSGALNLSP